MRKIAFFFAVFALASCGNGGNKQNTDNVPAATAVNTTNTAPAAIAPADWKTYTHDNYSIHYPPTWSLREGPGVAAFTIQFVPDTDCPNAGENVSMGSQDVGGENIDLNELAEGASAQFKTMLTNYSLLSSNKLTDAAGDYEQTIFSGEMSSQKLMYEQRYRIINGKIYILTLACPKEGWDIGQKTGEQIMSLFTLTK